MRLSGAGEISSAETGLNVLMSRGQEAQGIQAAAAASADFRRYRMEIKSLLNYTDNETHLPLPVNRVPIKEEGSPSKWETDQVAVPSKRETDQVAVPSKSDQDSLIDEPSHLGGSGRPLPTWILPNGRPIKDWVIWPGANLIRANLQSVFATVVKITGLTEIRLIEIGFETPAGFFVIPMSREDKPDFEATKQLLHQIIANTGPILPCIWIAPNEIEYC